MPCIKLSYKAATSCSQIMALLPRKKRITTYQNSFKKSILLRWQLIRHNRPRYERETNNFGVFQIKYKYTPNSWPTLHVCTSELNRTGRLPEARNLKPKFVAPYQAFHATTTRPGENKCLCFFMLWLSKLKNTLLFPKMQWTFAITLSYVNPQVTNSLSCWIS